MLDNLGVPDWASLRDVRGSAVRLPGQLRALLSPDADTAARALDELEDSIFHQSLIFSGTVAAVPFLVELAASPEVRCRADILNVLTWLGVAGGSPTSAPAAGSHDPYPLPGWLEEPRSAFPRPPLPEDNAETAEALLAAVRAGQPAYLALLDDSSEDVQRAALGVLHLCPDAGPQVLPVVRRRLQGPTTDRLCIALLDAVHEFSGHDPFFVRLCDRLLAERGDDPVGARAATTRLSMSPPWPPSLQAATAFATGVVRGTAVWSGHRSQLLDDEQLFAAAVILLGGLGAGLTGRDYERVADAVVDLLCSSGQASRVATARYATLRRQALRLVLAGEPWDRRSWETQRADSWRRHVYPLVTAVFLGDARGPGAQRADGHDTNSTVLPLVLEDPIWSSRRREVLELAYYLLLAYATPGSRRFPREERSLTAEQRALARALSRAAIWEQEPEKMAALLHHFGLPQFEAALRGWLQGQS